MIAPLAAQLHALCDDQPFRTSWYLKDLRTGEEADRAGHAPVPSASTRKIAILMAALKAVHEGRLALEQSVTIAAEYQISDSGCFQHFRPGFTITLHDVLVMMIIVSDNACTGTVVDLLGLDAINDLCRAIGMRGTVHREGIPRASLLPGVAPPAPTSDPVSTAVSTVGSTIGRRINETTPADVGLLLDRILAGATNPPAAATLGCTPELCRLALDILLWQKLNTRLPFLLPANARVAHKTGTRAPVYNDAGVVYAGDEPRFILTVYSNSPAAEPPHPQLEPGARNLHIARLARTCWDVLCA